MKNENKECKDCLGHSSATLKIVYGSEAMIYNQPYPNYEGVGEAPIHMCCTKPSFVTDKCYYHEKKREGKFNHRLSNSRKARTRIW